MNRRYVVRPEERITLIAVLQALGQTEEALSQGRVFVGRKRATDGAAMLRTGDEVSVTDAPSGPAAERKPLRVIYEDDELVSVDKPAGVATVPDLRGASETVLGWVSAARNIDPQALIATSRLDRDVTGVVTFAKTPRANDRIAQARTEGRLSRRYVALGARSEASLSGLGMAGASWRGVWDAPIGRHADKFLRAPFGPDAKPAMSRFFAIASRPGGITLFVLAPVTGRTHQLRVHASHAGASLLGDRDYGGPTRLTLPSGRVLSLTRIALHCARVVLPLATGEMREVRAPVPSDLLKTWEALGGDAAAWDTAVACDV